VKFNFESINTLFEQLCVPYLVPKKGGKLEKQLMINWVNLPMNFFKGLPPDIREYVFSSFVEHNKDAAPIVYQKINNTETFIRKILKNVESKPWKMWSDQRDDYLRNLLKERNMEF
jgi:hypothetical protein